MSLKDKPVTFTGHIPVCPRCDKPTERSSNGSSSTLMGFTRRYDEQGEPIPSDPNTVTHYWYCYGCEKNFCVADGELREPAYIDIP